nr:PREDICTED: uncharacterized protein LOC103315075 isoform X1 [Tribolium castaneum]|eukprot:XP_015840028.1 PREDICTED: uncharacterized protein LOC103315075 isoform X1 [Tribolium castaneum]
MAYIKKCVNEVLAYVGQSCMGDDMVGVMIENEEFPDKPIGISFRKYRELTADVMLNVIAKVLQSNATFFTNDMLSIRFDQVRLPIGQGFRDKNTRYVTFEDFSVSKNSIFVIDNEDNNLCLAYALCIAKTFADNKFDKRCLKEYKQLPGKTKLHQDAVNLCNAAEVDLRNGGNFEHIDLFQKYLNQYTIVVYNSRDGRSLYFEGERYDGCPCLNLIMENNHYNVILSLTGAFTAKYFCERCSLPYSKKEGHWKCPYTCAYCHSKPPCDLRLNSITCDHCSRDFKGQTCFDNHIKNSLCSKLKKCVQCLTVYWEKKKKPHVCGSKYCANCKEHKSIRHSCYMIPKTNNMEKQENDLKTFLLVFYDFETTQDREFKQNLYQHEVNLCVAQQACHLCLNNQKINENCNNCGERMKIYQGDNILENFLNDIVEKSKRFKVTAVAHNMRSFDGCFILRQMFNDASRWSPEVIRNGTKLLTIKCGPSIRFIDSLNFIALPLSQFSNAFKLTQTKGYFPHFFNTKNNQNYVGPLPDAKYYGCNTMKTTDRTKFLKWYEEQVAADYIFNMQNEIIKYCIADVDVLRQGCLKFRNCFVETNNVDPLLECITIASACNLVFRRNFLKPQTIGIVPVGGYRSNDKNSRIAIEWLMWESQERDIVIEHAGNGREVRLNEGLLVDGYCEQNRTVFEFYGCFWHGCLKCYPNQTCSLSNKDDALFMRRETTNSKENRIKSYGYTLVTMWECEFRNRIKTNVNLKLFIKNLDIFDASPLNPRDAFFGGRTNACKLYYSCEQSENEVIKYFDVCSLYPFVNKYGKYPLGHPTKIYVGGNECSKVNINNFEGLIKCSVLPPTNLYHPVLPYRSNGKLTFPLCRTCVDNMNQEICNHDDAGRVFVGTYVADEIKKALELGYQIVEIYEMWEYQTIMYNRENGTNGLFTEYVNLFLKIKQECSGWPSWCVTEEDKQRYIQTYFEKEGVTLEYEKICKNPGLRFLAKIMLNSFWGKFGQRENLKGTEIIKQPKDLFALLTNPSTIVNNIDIINQDILLASTEKVKEDVIAQGNTNVVIAAYTTALARLELYKYLQKLDRRVLYFDTDSVIFTHKPGEWLPPVGDFLGDLTDEMIDYGEGSHITEFVSGGPKNYGYKFWSVTDNCYKSVCKVKGLTLHYTNSQLVNFDVIKSMICDETNDTNQQVELVDRLIVRDVFYNVLSKNLSKKYRINYTKRRRLDDNNYDTLPYGYK